MCPEKTLQTLHTPQLAGPPRPATGRSFLVMWCGESASLLGTQVTLVALPLFAVLTLHADSVAMGLIGASGSAAPLVLGLIAGPIADRHSRRRVLIAANLVRLVFMALLVVLALAHLASIALLCLFAFVAGAGELLFDAAMSGYVTHLVPRDSLMAANARLQGSAAAASVGGPGLTGVLVQLLGAPLTLLVDAASYVVSVVTLWRSPPDPRPAHRAGVRAGPARGRLYQSARSQLNIVLRHPVLRPIAVASAHTNFFTELYFAVLLLFLVRSLHFTPAEYGVFVAVGGAAGLPAAALAGRLRSRFGARAITGLAFFAPGISALLIPLALGTPRVITTVLVMAAEALWIGSVVVNLVVSETLKQSLVEPGMLGRATSVTRFLTWGTGPFGALAGGALGAAIGIRGTLFLGAIGLCTSAAWIWLSRGLVEQDLAARENGIDATVGDETSGR